MRTTTTLNIENLSVPPPIKTKLLELSGNIGFQRQSRKGSNGWLFFGVNKISRQPVAIKFYDWGGDQTYHAEPRHLAAIASENVIQILDASHVDGNYAYFLTPYFRNGDLDEELCRGNYGNIKSINFVRDILSGLSHLHADSLLHRDLKPQNILVSDERRAVIGDFGSVKKIPEGRDSVPGSGHSLIYRPPESVISGVYAIPSDIYQVGIVLFQLLGGNLPYEVSAWLNEKELRAYRSITDGVDQQIYANDCIKEKIRRGTVVNTATLPPWVCPSLKRTVGRACNIDPAKRFQSCSEFLAHINRIRNQLKNWFMEDGCLTLDGAPSFRVCYEERNGNYFVQKNGGAGWRRDNSFGVGLFPEQVQRILVVC